MAQEQLQEQELRAGELDQAIAAVDLVGDRVEDQIRVAQDLRARLAVPGSPQQRAEASLKLAEGEGLDEIVVGADVKALDPVIDRVSGREHEDRCAVAGLAQAATDLEPIELGHQDVQDDGIGGLAGQSVQGLLTVLGQGHVVVLEPQSALQGAANRGLIVDYQYVRHLEIMARTRKSS